MMEPSGRPGAGRAHEQQPQNPKQSSESMNEHEQTSVQLPPGAAFERHFSVQEIAKMWGLGVDLIRRLFANEEGIVRIAHPETLHKRGYCTLRIPESVARRVHRKLTHTNGKVN
jgi:hypothetical protein